MAKRFRIGLNYFFDNQTNSGIVNYIYNIISALNTLPEGEKPNIVVFYSVNAPVDYLKSIGYPYINFLLFKPTPGNKLLFRLNRKFEHLFHIDLYKKFVYFNKIDCLYPYFGFMDTHFAAAKNKIHWLVDFNNRAFPNHYNDNGSFMNSFQQKLTDSTERVILSSNTLFNELKHYYPNYKCDVRVLRFASSLPPITSKDIDSAMRNHKIDMPYFMSPNQFWEHKNQGIVLEALQIIKQFKPEIKFKVLFSGSLEVNRGKGLYINKLKEQINQFGLAEYVAFLGILERKEQLSLMKGAISLIQPSLYEGWSTLVEEAKALSQFIILSELAVHKEQINNNVDFFNPHDAGELAQKMIKQLEKPSQKLPVDYHKNIREFGKSVINEFR